MKFDPTTLIRPDTFGPLFVFHTYYMYLVLIWPRKIINCLGHIMLLSVVLVYAAKNDMAF